MVDKKPWYESKIVWVNVITFLVTVLGMVADMEFVTPHVAQIVLMALAALNVLLRMLTSQPITEQGAKNARSVRRKKAEMTLGVLLAVVLVSSCALAPKPELSPLQKTELAYAQASVAYEAAMLSLVDARKARVCNDSCWQMVDTLQTEARRYQPLVRSSLDVWRLSTEKPANIEDLLNKLVSIVGQLQAVQKGVQP